MSFGNFDGLMQQKYNILGQQANAAEMEAKARSGLYSTQAALMPGQTASENALRRSQAGSYDANAYKTQQEGNMTAPLAQSQIGEAGARTLYHNLMGKTLQNDLNPLGILGPHFLGQMGVPEGVPEGDSKGKANVGAKTGGKASGKTAAAAPQASMQALMSMLGGAGGAGGPMPMPGSPMAATPGQGAPLGMFGGATVVPGKGSGKVDTVPAMLAPHEAVLNKAAAEKLGRGKIAALNKEGAKKEGLTKPPLRKGMV